MQYGACPEVEGGIKSRLARIRDCEKQDGWTLLSSSANVQRIPNNSNAAMEARGIDESIAEEKKHNTGWDGCAHRFLSPMLPWSARNNIASASPFPCQEMDLPYEKRAKGKKKARRSKATLKQRRPRFPPNKT